MISLLVQFSLLAFMQDEGPVQPPLQIGAHMRMQFAFDWSGLGVDGLPHTAAISEIVFRFSVPGGDPVTWRRVSPPTPVTPGVVRVPFSLALKDIPPGIYAVDVSLRNSLGGVGNYGLPVIFQLIPEPPPPPPPSSRPSTPTALRVEPQGEEA